MWWVIPITQDTTSPTSRFDEGNILSPKPLLEVTQIVKHKKNIKDTFCWILGRVVPDRFTPVFLESVFRETKKRKSISTLKQLPKNYLVFNRTRKRIIRDLLGTYLEGVWTEDINGSKVTICLNHLIEMRTNTFLLT